jgi:hypothetical protein
MIKKPECNGARSFFNITLATNIQPLLLLLPKTCLLPVRRYRSSIHRKILIKYREGLVIELQNYYKILQRREFQLYWRLKVVSLLMIRLQQKQIERGTWLFYLFCPYCFATGSIHPYRF